MSETVIEQAEQGMERYFFRASAEDFKKVPGSPIAYWINDNARVAFYDAAVEDVSIPKFGMSVGDGGRFIRFWHEVGIASIGSDCSSEDEFVEAEYKWCPMDKGGGYRKWYGNQYHVVLWKNRGRDIKKYAGSAVRSPQYFFQPHFSWTLVGSTVFSSRYFPHGYILDTASNCVYFNENALQFKLLGLFNSHLSGYLLKFLNPTLNFSCGVVGKLPSASHVNWDNSVVDSAIKIAKYDFDYNEASMLFPGGVVVILKEDFYGKTLSETYSNLRIHWHEMTQEMQHLEEENNRIFIEAYGLQDELTPEVPLEQITLTCNPHYRYGGNKTDEEREALLLQDTMAEFCSYAVGCMFGRYSLDKPGLVLANQGDTLQDYLQQVPQPSFMPDDDNVIPLLDADWFADDVTGRFLDFLRVTFGTEHYVENLAFVERGLNIKNKRNYSIRDFFVKEFYDYHVRMYKKRPIYWLFASPKGTFQALVYLHRYRPDTVSVVLRYLREFRDKLAARRQLVEQRLTDASASQGEKTRLTKEQEQLRKQILELDDYEHDVLFPLAGQRLEIDLDDGVKANYPRFGKALKKVARLS